MENGKNPFWAFCSQRTRNLENTGNAPKHFTEALRSSLSRLSHIFSLTPIHTTCSGRNWVRSVAGQGAAEANDVDPCGGESRRWTKVFFWGMILYAYNCLCTEISHGFSILLFWSFWLILKLHYIMFLNLIFLEYIKLRVNFYFIKLNFNNKTLKFLILIRLIKLHWELQSSLFIPRFWKFWFERILNFWFP